jgi:hypothetical protein
VSDFQPSLRSQMTSLALSSMVPKDQIEEDLGKGLVATVATKAIQATAQSNNDITFGMVDALERLKVLGYGPKSDAAKNLVANTNAIAGVLNGVATKVGNIL